MNYREGSGRGRLVQYSNSARMSLHHPLLGVGPGNWAVVYPKFASPGDPSLATDGMTANPVAEQRLDDVPLGARARWRSSLLALAMIALLVDAVRALRVEGDPEHALSAWALLGTVAGAARRQHVRRGAAAPRARAHRVGPARRALAAVARANDRRASDVIRGSLPCCW